MIRIVMITTKIRIMIIMTIIILLKLIPTHNNMTIQMQIQHHVDVVDPKALKMSAARPKFFKENPS